VQLIKDQKIVDDTWQRIIEITADANLPKDDVPGGNIIVPFAYWLENKESLVNKDGMLGVCIDGDVDIQDVVKDIEHFDLIALDFPAFADGRSYSHARLLRDRYNFEGELRAVGDILRDQLFFMQRCGINSFQLREDKDIQDALNAFNELSVKYQTAADGAEPVYKYR
jgi:uncharacterized protein (DUF934 family)